MNQNQARAILFTRLILRTLYTLSIHGIRRTASRFRMGTTRHFIPALILMAAALGLTACSTMKMSYSDEVTDARVEVVAAPFSDNLENFSWTFNQTPDGAQSIELKGDRKTDTKNQVTAWDRLWSGLKDIGLVVTGYLMHSPATKVVTP